MTGYIELHNLYEYFQSAYRKYHSTETALIKVHNDIANVIDKKQSVIFLSYWTYLRHLTRLTMIFYQDYQPILEFAVQSSNGLSHTCQIVCNLLGLVVVHLVSPSYLKVFLKDPF